MVRLLSTSLSNGLNLITLRIEISLFIFFKSFFIDAASDKIGPYPIIAISPPLEIQLMLIGDERGSKSDKFSSPFFPILI